MPRRRRSPFARSAARICALLLAAALYRVPAASAQALAAATRAACPAAGDPAGARGLRELELTLSDWGDWFEVQPGQRAWRPRRVDRGWLPYRRGCWRWDGQSWSWVTDEPWGDATYHYGRWMLHPSYGWIWMPGATWGPAWVAWRRDGEVVGWAPLPPAGAPSMASWTFVPVDDFQAKWIDTVAVSRPQVPVLLLRMGILKAARPRSAPSRRAPEARVAAR